MSKDVAMILLVITWLITNLVVYFTVGLASVAISNCVYIIICVLLCVFKNKFKV